MNYSLTLATLGLFAAACTIQTSTPVEQPKLSSTVATNAIYPSTSAQSDGTNLTVYAALLSG
ncbi:hypothetical protein, partial [Clostridioides difficile]|uniref:hypothetical protein n=1 Tax=Clostridioides difficile TaxID=1496 RepID=UPI001A9B35FE